MMNASEEGFYHESEEKEEKGDGTMSAYTQNFVYEVGKKKQIEKDPSIISQERLKAIKAIVEKYRSSKK